MEQNAGRNTGFGRRWKLAVETNLPASAASQWRGGPGRAARKNVNYNAVLDLMKPPPGEFKSGCFGRAGKGLHHQAGTYYRRAFITRAKWKN
jgi:hypothetical protein